MMTRRMIVTTILLLAALLLWPTPSTTAQAPSGDYGDAPDLAFGDRFPTAPDTTNADLPDRSGPFHRDTSVAWLGDTITAEAIPAADDAGDDGWDQFSSTITVTLSNDAPADTTYYLNILIDINNSGHWNTLRTSQEWAVQNREINQAPGTSVGYEVLLAVPRARWVRITLTDTIIDPDLFADTNGWDGSGPAEGWGVGETEDYFVVQEVRAVANVTIADLDCALLLSVLHGLTWVRAGQGVDLAAIQDELPDFLAQLEPLDPRTDDTVAAFFATLDGADLDDYGNVLAATLAAQAAWDNCSVPINPSVCLVGPLLIARFYSSPSTESEFVDELLNDALLPVLAQTEDGVWLQVRMPNGFNAWVPSMIVGASCIG